MAKIPAIELGTGIYRVPTAPWDFINSYLFFDGDGQVTLVDTGLGRAPKRIRAALGWLGSAPSEVTRIILTHAHSDHAGGLSRIAAQTGAPVAAHERDAASVRSGRPPGRDHSTLGGRLVERLPGGGFAPTEVSNELVDGQVVDVGGGLEVIHTPGHTPGHVALLHRDSGILITGDSIFNVRGIRWSPRSLCTDFRLNKQTATRLAEFDYKVAAFTHGPEIRDEPREAIRQFLRRERVITE